jgi:hypothetical protein
MSTSGTKWKEIAIYKYIVRSKLVSLLREKAKAKEMDIKEEDLKMRVSNEVLDPLTCLIA